jgi:hypothetical protein
MILDKYLSFDQKVKIAIVAGSIWIYILEHSSVINYYQENPLYL